MEIDEEVKTSLKILSEFAWDSDLKWAQMMSWARNFNGEVFDHNIEKNHALFSLSRFVYFSKDLIREMLRALYRDFFRAPIIQRARRNLNHTRDQEKLEDAFQSELRCTRFIGLGNPAESGAHILYYFRQINRLPKNNFVDFYGAFIPKPLTEFDVYFEKREPHVLRYVFVDDFVGSGDQVSHYLADSLAAIKGSQPEVDLRFMCLFATKEGLERLNSPSLFDGNANCIFELDSSYSAFAENSRYFSDPPAWFEQDQMERIATHYGGRLKPSDPLGHRNGQLFLAMSHNTPDNTLPIFWDEGIATRWNPVFLRFDKNYG